MRNLVKKSILSLLAAAIIFASAGCDITEGQKTSDDAPVSRLSPADGFNDDTNETVTTYAEPDDDEFVYTFVTAPEVTTAVYTTAPVPVLTQPPREDLPTGGEVLNLYGWNEELKMYMEDYYLVDKPISDAEVNWIITSGTYDYQLRLDAALVSETYADDDDKIDLYLAETNYILKYVDTPYAVPITALGISENELANQYPYTRALATGTDGIIRATSYTATPVVTAYRRSIADDVLGVSEPDDVAPYLEDFTAFDETAGLMADKGYKTVSSYSDLYYSYINTAAQPIVLAGTSKITIPNSWDNWVHDTKVYTDRGYINGATGLWSDQWFNDITGNDVFCYQGPSWLIDYVLEPNAGDTYGDWGVVAGPVNTYWGGTYLLAGENTDNADYVADIMRYFTTDPVSMEKVGRDSGTYMNNAVVNTALSLDTANSSELLEGQNPFSAYNQVAMNIKPETAAAQSSKYGILCEYYQAAFTDYFTGAATKEQCLENFYSAVFDNYPELTK
jgi:hypothetical protein